MKRFVGIMTGNSMDAVDVVLTEFDGAHIHDVSSFTLPFTLEFKLKMNHLRNDIVKQGISMKDLDKLSEFISVHDEYIRTVAKAVNRMIDESNIDRKTITAVGSHGKTLDHLPPSLANGAPPHTLQIGSGQMLADLLGIPVVYDFRSNDIMHGGEGAPLAPTHNKNIAISLGFGDSIFYNAGNTSNLTVLSGDMVLGWDAGPFNEFPDRLVRTHLNEECDRDGRYGKQGRVNMKLIRALFENGAGYFDAPIPKSSDPNHYGFDKVHEFTHPTSIHDSIRTAEFFAAYTSVYTLKFIPDNIPIPDDFVLFGGGWKNPVSMQAFTDLLAGKAPVLPEHEATFKSIRARLIKSPTVRYSELGTYMEARIFADATRYYLEGRPWMAVPIRSGHTPSILGRMRKPGEGSIDDRISLAAKGWKRTVSHR